MRKIIIIAIILIISGGVLLFLVSKKTPVPKFPITNYLPITNQPGVGNQEIVQPRELTPEEKLALLKNELRLKARNFTERYGSFSSDAQFANLKELEGEMSQRFWRETENYILVKEKEPVQEFYGVTTKVLNIEEKNFSENEVNYLILTQRQEIKGTTQKVFYQEAEITIIKENNLWKVDQVNWR